LQLPHLLIHGSDGLNPSRYVLKSPFSDLIIDNWGTLKNVNFGLSLFMCSVTSWIQWSECRV
jgi:hypothetical protein